MTISRPRPQEICVSSNEKLMFFLHNHNSRTGNSDKVSTTLSHFFRSDVQFRFGAYRTAVITILL